MLAKVVRETQDALDAGKWDEVKLLVRFLACLQGILSDDGILPILDQFFDLAADFQAANTLDATGFEVVKIILLSLPYAVASVTSINDKEDYKEQLGQKVLQLLEKTDIIASAACDDEPQGREDDESHRLKQSVNPYPGNSENKPFGYQSALHLLQQQVKRESEKGWTFSCIPRPYKRLASVAETPVKTHALPAITIPSPANLGETPCFPEAFFSIYADQDMETVPRTTDIACSLVRDVVVDTINRMDFNRAVAAKILIEHKIYWAPEAFAPRGTAVDKLKDLPEGSSTWKAEDAILDGIFSQIFKLPNPPHKLVYYHSIITELCRQSAGTIAPCLGRAMRWLFRHTDDMDLELTYRFLDWFGHHLSNFEFRWKWDEWAQYLDASNLNPQKAFIIAAIDKETRLSFARRIRDTLPQVYHSLITEGKEKDVPDFKFKQPSTPFSQEGREIHALIRKKAPEEEVQKVIDRIHEQAAEHGFSDPLIASTDAYMTAVCFIGSKSLSHVLSCIERCKERLMQIGQESEAARRQIIQSVVDYWKDQPGVAVNIVDKLLNYTIVTPESVIVWALGPEYLGNGSGLALFWRFEMVAATVGKVTNRVRQIASHKVQAGPNLPEEQARQIDEVLTRERDEQMSHLFSLIFDQVRSVADGTADGTTSSDLSAEDTAHVKSWGFRWLRVFERKQLVEHCIVGPHAVESQTVVAELVRNLKARKEKEYADAMELKERERARVVEEERQKRRAEEDARESATAGAEVKDAAANGNGDADMGVDNLDVAPDTDMIS